MSNKGYDRQFLGLAKQISELFNQCVESPELLLQVSRQYLDGWTPQSRARPLSPCESRKLAIPINRDFTIPSTSAYEELLQLLVERLKPEDWTIDCEVLEVFGQKPTPVFKGYLTGSEG